MIAAGTGTTGAAGAAIPARDRAAFRLLRYFSIASFVAIVLAAGILGFFYREIAVKQLITTGEDNNIALAKAFANMLRPEYLPLIERARELKTSGLATQPEVAVVHQELRGAVKGTPVVKVKIFDLQGRTIYSSEMLQIGEDRSTNEGFVVARAGSVKTEFYHRESFYAFGQTILNRKLLGSYVPVLRSGSDTIDAVFELYSDVTPFFEEIGRTQRDIVIGVAAVLVLLYGALFVIVKRADDVIKRQDEERKRNEDIIRHLATHDTLTTLPNRNLFRDRLALAIARAARSEHMAALMFLDLDRFKEINDTLGHAAGDKLLQAAAELLQRSIRPVDTVARLGGDEFTIIVEDITEVDQATMIAERIKKGFSNAIITHQGQDIFVTASIGITLYPIDADNIEALLQTADLAMYRAKGQGRDTYAYFSPALPG